MSGATRVIRHSGFTLIEVVAVIVILGIVASIGSQFVVTAVQSYRATEIQQKLTQRARLTIEQMTRELRSALPNAVRISSTGSCIEFFPSLAATRYVKAVPTPDNGRPTVNTIETVAFEAPSTTASFVAIAPFNPGEAYTASSPSAVAAIASVNGAPATSITLSASHTFSRNSTEQRVYITETPVRFCAVDGDLMRFSDYGLITSTITDAAPGGTGTLMSHQVLPVDSAFALSPGSEDRNTTVLIQLRFSNGSRSVQMQQQVAIRNVP